MSSVQRPLNSAEWNRPPEPRANARHHPHGVFFVAAKEAVLQWYDARARTGVHIRLVMIDSARVALRIMWRLCSAKRLRRPARKPLMVNHNHSDASTTLLTARNGPNGVAAPIT